MKRYVFICCLFLTLSYASNTEKESDLSFENTIVVEEGSGLTLQQFETIPLEEL